MVGLNQDAISLVEALLGPILRVVNLMKYGLSYSKGRPLIDQEKMNCSIDLLSDSPRLGFTPLVMWFARGSSYSLTKYLTPRLDFL